VFKNSQRSPNSFLHQAMNKLISHSGKSLSAFTYSFFNRSLSKLIFLKISLQYSNLLIALIILLLL